MSTTALLQRRPHVVPLTDPVATPVRPIGPVDYTRKGAHMRAIAPVQIPRGVDRPTTAVVWLTALLLGVLAGLVTDDRPTNIDQGPPAAAGPTRLDLDLDEPGGEPSPRVEPVADRHQAPARGDTTGDSTPDSPGADIDDGRPTSAPASTSTTAPAEPADDMPADIPATTTTEPEPSTTTTTEPPPTSTTTASTTTTTTAPAPPSTAEPHTTTP